MILLEEIDLRRLASLTIAQPGLVCTAAMTLYQAHGFMLGKDSQIARIHIDMPAR